jgi:hypothetical protein
VSFVQVIEFRTSKIGEVRRLGNEYAAKGGDELTVRRILRCEDHDEPGHYFNLVFFDSAESAMENSDLPVTHEYYEKMMALADGAHRFYNLDVEDIRD